MDFFGVLERRNPLCFHCYYVLDSTIAHSAHVIYSTLSQRLHRYIYSLRFAHLGQMPLYDVQDPL